MISITPDQFKNNHIRRATNLYGEDYMNDPYYITSKFKELFEIQYSHLIVKNN